MCTKLARCGVVPSYQGFVGESVRMECLAEGVSRSNLLAEFGYWGFVGWSGVFG